MPVTPWSGARTIFRDPLFTASSAAGSPLKRFDYSPALRVLAKRRPRWDEALLDRYIADPEAVAPRTSMTFTGMRDQRERADLIAYLRQAR